MKKALTLTHKETNILELRDKGYTLKECAIATSLTKEQVRFIHKKALVKAGRSSDYKYPFIPRKTVMEEYTP